MRETLINIIFDGNLLIAIPVAVIAGLGYAIKKYIPNVDFYDWLKPEDNTVLWMNEKWREYDYIISNTSLLTLNKLYGITPCQDMLKRFIIISHCPKFNHPYFHECIPERIQGVQYAGVSKDTCEEMKRHGIPSVAWTPFGADVDVFRLTHRVSGPIQRIGIVGGNERSTKSDYTSVKRFDMFDEVCQQLGIEGVYIHSRSLEEGSKVYEGIDLLMCCSEFEAGPLGIFEAASCGIPVLCRPVGNAKEISGICTFETVDEAVRRIRLWNSDWSELATYARHVTHEVRVHWNMRHLIRSHVLPLIQPRDVVDFIEIGTSDFDTEIEKQDGRTGISVEPIKEYLDRLPNNERVIKVHGAISDFDGEMNIYSVKEYEKYRYRDWETDRKSTRLNSSHRL